MFFRKLALIAVVACTLNTFAAEPASPSLAPDSRCFEMRTYFAAPDKLEALHARFRDHTCKLFVKHGMQLVGFWVPMDKNKKYENKLVYILGFPSREARDKAFKEFGQDPEWIKVRDESEKNGKIVERVESVFMTATDYSAIK